MDTTHAEQLSPLDLLMPRTYIQVLLVFERPGPADETIQSLQSGLDRLSDRIPWLSGRVFSGEPDQEKTTPEIRWHAGDAPTIVDKGTITTAYEWARSHGMPGEAIPSDVWPVSSVIDEVCLVTGAPVFASSIFRFADRGAGLCVCIHHNAVDASGFSKIIQLWAQNVRDPRLSLSIKSSTRSDRLSQALSINLQATLSESTESLLTRHPEFCTKPPTIPETFPACTSKVFTISTHWIHILRDLMQTQDHTLTRPSTNTIISALIWTSITRVRTAHNPSLAEEPSRLAMAVNGRQRLSASFSTPASPYLGNAVIYSLSQLPVRLLSAADRTPVRELATICQHIGHAQSDSLINSRHIAEVHTLVDRVGYQALFVGWDLFRSRDLTITSWAGFDLYEADFGEGLGRPAFVRLPDMQADGVAIILPRRREPDEVLEVMVMLRREHMESLEVDAMWRTLCEGVIV